METNGLYIQTSSELELIRPGKNTTSTTQQHQKGRVDRPSATDSVEQKLSRLHLELRKSHREVEALNAFSYSIAHDIRSPLNSISMLAHLIKQYDHASGSTEMEGHVEKIEKQVLRLNLLIDDLLLFARHDIIIEKEKVDMYKVVNEVVEELKFSYKITRPGHLTICSLPTVTCNPGLIRQVWSNLISNAIKYSSKQESPIIKIGYAASRKTPEFWVEDNGIGFGKSESKGLFEPFTRLESARGYEGTGVGLALCKRIIEKHGGQIRAKSTIGKQTVFSFNL